jgi:site-specific DNA recombinase
MGESAQKVIGYIRVSTDEQATEGISLEVQRDRIIHYCQQFGLNLLDIYQDEWTGKELRDRDCKQRSRRWCRPMRC